MNTFTNTTFDEIAIGRSLAVSRTISRTDLEALAFVSGDIDESHLDRESKPGRGAAPGQSMASGQPGENQ